MFKLAVLAAILGSAMAGGRGVCPKAMGKYPFDDQKMAGQWIMIASTHAGTPDGVRCAKFTYHPATENISTIDVSATKAKDGSPWKAEILLQSLGKSGSGISVHRTLDDGKTSPVYMESIIATDYDNYAVIMACAPIFKEDTKSFGRILKVNIVSRKSTIPVETFNVLKNLISGYDVDPQTLNLVESVEC